MASKRERAFRKVRVVIDVVNIILSIAVVVLRSILLWMCITGCIFFQGFFIWER